MGKITIALLVLLVLFQPILSSNNETKQFQTIIASSLDPNTSDYLTDYSLESQRFLYDIVELNDHIWMSEFNASNLLKFDPLTRNLEIISLPTNITPYFMDTAPDNTLWFLDYNNKPLNTINNIVRYDTLTGNLTLFELPINAHILHFEIENDLAFASIPNLDKLIIIDTLTFEWREIEIACGNLCGPAGLDYDNLGNLWMAETYGNRLIKIDLETEEIIYFDIPEPIYGPVYVEITENDILWTGTHGGDRLLRVDLATMGFKQYISPQSSESQFPISGINDIEISLRGDIWFAKHFINRIGNIDVESDTIMEYILPRRNPITPTIQIVNNQVWFPETTGYFGYLHTDDAPKFRLSPILNQTMNGRTLTIDMEVEYVSGINDEYSLKTFGEVRNDERFKLQRNRHLNLQRGEKATLTLDIELKGEVSKGIYPFVLGVNGTTFTASQQFHIYLENNFSTSSKFSPTPEMVVIGIFVVATGILYRKEILDLIKRINNQSKIDKKSY